MLYPAFMLTTREAITGGDFALVFCVMGIYGVIPIHLMELVNATHRTFLSGLVYQLGNLASSASLTIEADLGAKFPIHREGKKPIYDYGKVMAIFCGAIFAYIIVLVFLGPERFHRDLKVNADHLLLHLGIHLARVSEESFRNDEYDEEAEKKSNELSG